MCKINRQSIKLIRKSIDDEESFLRESFFDMKAQDSKEFKLHLPEEFIRKLIKFHLVMKGSLL